MEFIDNPLIKSKINFSEAAFSAFRCIERKIYRNLYYQGRPVYR